MTFQLNVRALVVAPMVALLSSIQAYAHAPVTTPILPVHHTSLALQALLLRKPATVTTTSFNHLTRDLLYNRIPGYSASNSAFLLQVKQATGTGILNGITTKLNSGPVSSGQLYGTFYQYDFGNPGGSSFGGIAFGLGSSPLNAASHPNTIPMNTSSFFTIAKGGQIPGLSVATLNSLVKSQANNPVFLASLNGLKEGEKIATTGLSGGILNGTEYIPGSSYGYGTFAFGNNPFNTQLSINQPLSSLYLSPSYLTFLNKINIRLGSAQIAGNVFQDNMYSVSSPFLIASGSNPLNTLSAHAISENFLLLSSFFKALK